MSDEIKLKHGPWLLRGAYVMPALSRTEVNTPQELVEQLTKLLELSPTGEVSVSYVEDTTENNN